MSSKRLGKNTSHFPDKRRPAAFRAKHKQTIVIEGFMKSGGAPHMDDWLVKTKKSRVISFELPN